jgi:hypothetical protein
MKNFFFLAVIAMLVHPGIDAQENFLTAQKSLDTSIPIEGYYSAIDISNDLLYALAGDTVYIIDIANGTVSDKMSVSDQSYSGFPAFLTVDQVSMDIWVGYTTTGNVDDRIYKYASELEEWSHVATFPSNFDLALRNGIAFVAGLNSSNFEDPNGIWLLDESGDNEHRMLIAAGGYSAGLDIDIEGNLYYATSFFSDNSLLKWSTSDITVAIEDTQDTLKIEDAEVLASLPAGAYDIDLDVANNIAFNCNNFVVNFIGMWDGEFGYDTLATSDQYLTHLATLGDLSVKNPANKVFALAYGSVLSEVHYEIPSSVTVSFLTDEITVYPNPVQDNFRIETENMDQAYLILSDMSGRSVLKQEYSNSGESVDVSFLIPGNYVMTYVSKGLVHKAVIQKK